MTSRDDVIKAVEELRPTYGSNSFLLFAMGLRLGNTDYDQIFRDHVLDGPDDKKVDFLHIDREAGSAIAVQAYERQAWGGGDAPVNKASDLNTATSWLFDADLRNIPRESVRAAAEELRDALESGEVHTVEVGYVHNCATSKTVDDELGTVEASLRSKLEMWSRRLGSPISGVARQFSLDDVTGLYESRYSSIRVNERLTIRALTPPQDVAGPNWRAFFTTVPAADLVALVERYGEAIYSANIRDYLGRRASGRNINRQIALTAAQNPQLFWVFNNGISLLSRQVKATADALECSGLAVINGAQTLGSLKDASASGSVDDVMLLVRVVESRDEGLIQQIIRYNNTQNPIKPWELRVLDPVQEQIARDFREKLSITYQFRRGLGRRGGEDVVCEKLGPWANSFYGQPIQSHRNSPEVFENEGTYRRLFNDRSDVRHLLFIYRLGEAIGATKDEYRALTESGKASETDSTLYSYFRYGVFTHVALHLCAVTLAELFGGGPNVKMQFALDDGLVGDRPKAIGALKRTVKFALAPVPSELAGKDPYEQLRSSAGIENLASRVRVSVKQMQSVAAEVIERLREGVQLI
jgi:hypothetical protein